MKIKKKNKNLFSKYNKMKLKKIKIVMKKKERAYQRKVIIQDLKATNQMTWKKRISMCSKMIMNLMLKNI